MISLCLLLAVSCGPRNRRRGKIMSKSAIRIRTDHIHGEYAKKEYERALELLNDRELEEAKLCFSRADSADPNNPEILTDLGSLMGTIYTDEASYVYFDRVLLIDSGFYRAYLNYGYWLNRGNRYKEAKIILNKGLRIPKLTRDERRPLYLSLAYSFHQTGHDSLALVCLSYARRELTDASLLENIAQLELSVNKSYNNRGYALFQDTTDAIKLQEDGYNKIKNTDDLGDLVSLVGFRIKTNNIKEYPDGYTNSMAIEHPENEIKGLLDKNEVPMVLYEVRNICILYDYPLRNSCTICTHFNHSITRKDLAELISRNYHTIYQEEEKTAPVKPIPPPKRILRHKRNETSGTYGIWGHDLSDLRLEECKVYRKKDGSILLTLRIEN